MGLFDSFGKKKAGAEPAKSGEGTPPASKEQTASGRWQIGDNIENRYEIRQILGGPGKSGMGIVYVCYDHEFHEAVALKTFQDRYLQDQSSIDRFKWEAETWVRLEKHYNIVQAKLVTEIQGRPYIFLEYVAGDEQYGVDLSGWIWRGGLTIPLALNFAIQFCQGMVHAQKKFREMGKPFVHRDIKPANIMVTKDRVVKVTDFGLVKAFADSGEDGPSSVSSDERPGRVGWSKSGAICGTPPYMSPEQCRGEKDIDIRSDVYSFGCVLYEMITRRLVFEVQTFEDFIHHHLKTTPKAPGVNRTLDGVVMRCLEKDPRKRYQDFEELREPLSKIHYDLTGEVVKPREAGALVAWELNNKGVSLANLGFHGEALGCYLRALSINPEHGKVHYNLGLAYSALGRHNEAAERYREALRINPGDAYGHNNLGLTYSAQGRHEDAIKEFEEAFRINPAYAEAYYNLGNAYALSIAARSDPPMFAVV